jgi:hypothetical protein
MKMSCLPLLNLKTADIKKPIYAAEIIRIIAPEQQHGNPQ